MTTTMTKTFTELKGIKPFPAWTARTVYNQAAYNLFAHGVSESKLLAVPEIAAVLKTIPAKKRKEIARGSVQRIRYVMENGTQANPEQLAEVAKIDNPTVRARVLKSLTSGPRTNLADAIKDAAEDTLTNQVLAAVPGDNPHPLHVKEKLTTILDRTLESLYKWKLTTALSFTTVHKELAYKIQQVEDARKELDIN